MHPQLNLYSVALLSCTALATICAPTARAEVTEVLVEYATPFGEFNGHEYVQVQGLMSGTVQRDDGSTGTYRVPMEIIYPVDGGANVAFFDLPNGYWFRNYGPNVCDRGTTRCEDQWTGNRLEKRLLTAGLDVLDTHVFEEGLTYFAVQWWKWPLDFFGPEPPDGTRRNLLYGSIEQSTDGWTVIHDATEFLRDTSSFNAQGLTDTSVQAVDNVIAYGHSQTGMLLNTYLLRGYNKDAGGNNYIDGFLISTTGSICYDFTDEAPLYITANLCRRFPVADGGFWDGAPPVTAGEKIMWLNTQSEIERFLGWEYRATEENDPDNQRWYELAGVAHISAAIWGLSYITDRDSPWIQNPADPRPFYRAAATNMVNWLKQGTAPPSGTYLQGEGSGAFFVAEIDADGNALGGIRLPHMETTLADGTVAGAPLGIYGGYDWHFFLDPSCVPDAPVLAPSCNDRLPGGYESGDPMTGDGSQNHRRALGGAYLPFAPDVVSSRYPTAEAYHDRVVGAAQSLLDDGFILQKDFQKFSETYSIPEVSEPEIPSGGGGGGCTVSGSRQGDDRDWFSLGLLLAATSILVRRRR